MQYPYLSLVTDLCTAVRSLETVAQGIKLGPSPPKVELKKFSGDVIITLMRKLPDEGLKRKSVDTAGDLIKSNGRAAYLVSLILLERQHSVSTMDMEKNRIFLHVLREKVRILAKERQITGLKSQHLLLTVKKISRASPYLPEFH